MRTGTAGIKRVGTSLRDTRGRKRILRSCVPAVTIILAGAMLAGCGGSKSQKSILAKKTKEYFAESEYGVKASPRVTLKSANLPRGGGREQVGKPYKVKGQWYHPKEVSSYSRVGKASWYGDAFHGRLTANGEIYDMTHLTAAHPTLPLPSYARVTNLENGNSVIVRINDRGPFAHGRIIDLSKRAAQMLDYTQRGVAEVKVDYIGRAPLHGEDDEYLLASYRPGGADADPSDGLPSGVLVAMNGPAPEDGARRPPSIIAGQLLAILPEIAPIPQERPKIPGSMALRERMGLLVSSYAPEPAAPAHRALERLASGNAAADAVVDSWKRQQRRQHFGETVLIGTFESRATADRLLAALSGFGPATLERSQLNGRTVHTLTMRAAGGAEADLLLEAWSLGATDAFVVRD